MTQKVTTRLVDDLIGDTIEEGKSRTVTFVFDGANYEIDPSNVNADHLREAFSDYIAAVRKSGIRSGRASSGSSPKRGNSEEFGKIRSGQPRTGTRCPRVAGSARRSATRTTPCADATCHAYDAAH